MNDKYQALLIRAYKGRADTYSFVGEYDHSYNDYYQIKNFSSDPYAKLTFLMGDINLSILKGDFSNALKSAAQAARFALKYKFINEHWKINEMKATALMRIGRIDYGFELAKKLLNKLPATHFMRSNKNELKAGLISLMGTMLFTNGHYGNALRYYQQSWKLCAGLNNIAKRVSHANNLCLINWKLQRYEAAIKYGTESLRLSTQIGNTRAIGMSLNNLGLIYDEMGDYKKGKNLFEKAHAYFQRIGDLIGISTTLFNIAGYYKDIAGDLKSAEEFFLKSQSANTKMSDIYSMVEVLLALGSIYEEKEDTKKLFAVFDSLQTKINQVKNRVFQFQYLALCCYVELLKKNKIAFSKHFMQLLKIYRTNPKSEENTLIPIIRLAVRCNYGKNKILLRSDIDLLEDRIEKIENPLQKAKLYDALQLWHASLGNNLQTGQYRVRLDTIAKKYNINVFLKK